MFGLFKSKEQKAITSFWSSDLGQQLVTHSADYFGPGKVWGDFSAETKEKINGWLIERILGVVQSTNPGAELRVELAAMTSCYAQFAVLLEGQLPQNLRSRYVSNELHCKIRACAPHNKEVAEEAWRNPNATDAELLGFTNTRSVYYNFVLNGLNILRVDFGDAAQGSERDWLQPFVKSMLIWHEDIYRSKIDLPRLADEKIMFNALAHSNFFGLVHNGARNPLFEWESAHGSHADACD